MKQPAPKSASHETHASTEFSFGSGTSFANNDEYASKELKFEILEIKFDEGRGYEGGDRWALTVETAGREREVMSLGSNPKRDVQMREAQAHLHRGGALKGKKLRLSGNTYYIVDGKP